MKALKFILVLALAFAYVFGVFISYLDWPAELSLLGKVAYGHNYVSDYLLFVAVLLLIFARPLCLRLLSFLLFFLFAATHFFQLEFLKVTGEFLPSVALENARHIEFVNLQQIALQATLWLASCLAIYYCLILTRHRDSSWSLRVFLSMLIIIVAMFFRSDHIFLSDSFVAQRADYFKSDRSRTKGMSPIVALSNSFREFYQHSLSAKWLANQRGDGNAHIQESGAKFIQQFHPQLGALNPDYPLMREVDYSRPLSRPDNFERPNNRYNLIVFFLEGVSSRIIQPYSDLFAGISPNLERVANDKVLQVDNYFSHAYATFRALGGQLCSSYNKSRLRENVDYFCLAHALQKEGYDTQFLYSQSHKRTSVGNVFKRAGFSKVADSLEIARWLKLDLGPKPSMISDSVLIDGLIEHLAKQTEEPFFVGLYTIDTHTGRRLDYGKKYRGKDGVESYVLDTFYNLDIQIGRFWEYFVNSRFYGNTIVVFTSDHATYPSRDYNALVAKSENYRAVFADKIPLLIYHPDFDGPARLDAANATSLNLTPSLLHLLGAQVSVVPFVGKSIFDANLSFPSPAVSGGTLLLNRPGRRSWVRISKSVKEDYLENAEEGVGHFEFMLMSQELEQVNRIWKE